MLAWGETTILRYLEGDVPIVECSERLKYLLTSWLTYVNEVAQYIINANRGESHESAYLRKYTILS